MEGGVDVLLVVLRLVHVVFGAIWVGMAVFASMFLGPAIQDAGPEGGKVMAALQRRGVMTVLPLLGLGTLISGLWLYWRMSAGLHPGVLTSRVGLAFGFGGLAALAAFALGVAVARPAMERAGMLAQSAQSGRDDAERQGLMAEVGKLRARSVAAGRLSAWLLIVAAAAMSVARYL
jgi:hypothetical protein